jgi:hypothetical protein
MKNEEKESLKKNTEETKIDYYIDKITDYYKEHNTIDLTKKIMFYINDCLNLLDNQLVNISDGEIDEYRKKGVLALDSNNLSEILGQLNIEISKKVKPYNEMSDKEKMAFRALLSFFSYPSDNDWSKYERLDFFIDFFMRSGVEEKSIIPILYNHFSNII